MSSALAWCSVLLVVCALLIAPLHGLPLSETIVSLESDGVTINVRELQVKAELQQRDASDHCLAHNSQQHVACACCTQVDKSTGNFTLSIDGQQWFSSGPVAVRNNSRTLTNANSSLVVTDSKMYDSTTTARHALSKDASRRALPPRLLLTAICFCLELQWWWQRPCWQVRKHRVDLERWSVCDDFQVMCSKPI